MVKDSNFANFVGFRAHITHTLNNYKYTKQDNYINHEVSLN